jgi:hypothetical protein
MLKALQSGPLSAQMEIHQAQTNSRSPGRAAFAQACWGSDPRALARRRLGTPKSLLGLSKPDYQRTECVLMYTARLGRKMQGDFCTFRAAELAAEVDRGWAQMGRQLAAP